MRIAKRDHLNHLVSRAERNKDPVLTWMIDHSESFDSDVNNSLVVKTAGYVVMIMKQFQDKGNLPTFTEQSMAGDCKVTQRYPQFIHRFLMVPEFCRDQSILVQFK